MRRGLFFAMILILSSVISAQSPHHGCHRSIKRIDGDTRLIILKGVAPCGWWVKFPARATWAIHPDVPITAKPAINQKSCKLNQYGILKTTRSGCMMVIKADRKYVNAGAEWTVVLGQVWLEN